jgi:hypothetical protein
MGKAKPDRESVGMADGVSIVLAAMVSECNGQHPKLARRATATLVAMQNTTEYALAMLVLELRKEKDDEKVSTESI